MSLQYYGINRGQTEFDIDRLGQKGTSSPGCDVEIFYDTTKGLLKSEILVAIDQMKNQIIKDNFPV